MENIYVAARIRPPNRREFCRDDKIIWEYCNTQTIKMSQEHATELTTSKKIGLGVKTSFNFDRCFNTADDNFKIYETVARKVVLSSLKGFNGTIFMYGQTGAGKTFTMLGGESQMNIANQAKNRPFDNSLEQRSRGKSADDVDEFVGADCTQENMNTDGNSGGILVQALRDLFAQIEKDLEKTYFIKCSYVEIYNDQIFDLLKPRERFSSEILTIGEDSRREFYIKDVTEEFVGSLHEVLQKLHRGERNRHYAQTYLNHSSSRSHTIFRLHVQAVTNSLIRRYRHERRGTTNVNNSLLRSCFLDDGTPESGTLVTESLLNFVDLAGSEKASNHYMMMDDPAHVANPPLPTSSTFADPTPSVVRERVKESQHINKSLFFLMQVISLKAEGKDGAHIPYRNSPLTKILRSSLGGGNSRTLIILCVTPVASQWEQTLSTLRFGTNAKKVENLVEANIITNKDDEAVKILISDYERKYQDLQKGREKDQDLIEELENELREADRQKHECLEKLKLLQQLKWLSLSNEINLPQPVTSPLTSGLAEASHLDGIGLLYSKRLGNDRSSRDSHQYLPSSSQSFTEHLALAIAKQRQAETVLLHKHISVLETHAARVNTVCATLLEDYYRLSHGFNELFSIFETFSQVGNDFIMKTCATFERLQLLEGGPSISLKGLSKDELAKFEQLGNELIDRAKEESARRRLKEKYPQFPQDEDEGVISSSKMNSPPMLSEFSKVFDTLITKLEETQEQQANSQFYVDEIEKDHKIWKAAVQARISELINANEKQLQKELKPLLDELATLRANLTEAHQALSERQSVDRGLDCCIKEDKGSQTEEVQTAFVSRLQARIDDLMIKIEKIPGLPLRSRKRERDSTQSISEKKTLSPFLSGQEEDAFQKSLNFDDCDFEEMPLQPPPAPTVKETTLDDLYFHSMKTPDRPKVPAQNKDTKSPSRKTPVRELNKPPKQLRQPQFSLGELEDSKGSHKQLRDERLKTPRASQTIIREEYVPRSMNLPSQNRYTLHRQQLTPRKLDTSLVTSPNSEKKPAFRKPENEQRKLFTGHKRVLSDVLPGVLKWQLDRKNKEAEDGNNSSKQLDILAALAELQEVQDDKEDCYPSEVQSEAAANSYVLSFGKNDIPEELNPSGRLNTDA